jgi:VCBS repeat-containing protein
VAFGGNAGVLGGATAGNYGTLTLNSDGSYRYVLDAENPDIVALDSNDSLTETFEYEITDADGDPAIATLTIGISGRDDGVIIRELNFDGAELSLSEANLADGSAPDPDALVRTGSFSIDAPDGLANLTIGGAAVFDGGIVDGVAVTTDHGVLTITGFEPLFDANGDVVGGRIHYSYELTDNLLLHSGTNDDVLAESFAIVVTDSDGTVASDSLDVAIGDDRPLAEADSGDIGEGQTLVADANAGLLVNDVDGADDVQIAGVRAAGGNLTAAVSGGVGTAIAGLYGTLTVAADGSYSYVSNPNAVPAAGGIDIFVYTLRDGDGDLSTTTLTITLDDSGLSASTVNATVSEAALSDGSDPDSEAETVAGDLNSHVAGGNGPYSFALTGDGIGKNGVLTINADGSYSYTLGSPITGLSANDGANIVAGADSFTYTVTDAFGNSTQNTITIDIIDDVPIARADSAIIIAEDAATLAGDLLANDTPGADGASLTSVTINGVTVAIAASGTTTHNNAFGTYSFDASGAWSFDPKPSSSASALDAGFSYTITDGDGDKATATQAISLVDGQDPRPGAPITLTLDDQNLLEGSTPNVSPSFPLPVTSGAISFTAGSDPIVSIGFGDLAGLGGGLTWTFESPTTIIGWYTDIPIVQLDLAVVGLTATVTATLLTNYPFHGDITADDLAAMGFAKIVATDSDGDVVVGQVNVAISDDVPSISGRAVAAGLLSVDETNLAQDATANFQALFNIVKGADQPATMAYSFAVNPVSGLVDVATGSSILLFASGNVVEGRVGGAAGAVVFRLTVDANGVATLDQMGAVAHPDAANPNDPVTMIAMRISLTATVTDSEGDTASTTVDVGHTLVFRDDGPSIDVGGTDGNVIVLTTQDADSIGLASDTATVSLEGAFSSESKRSAAARCFFVSFPFAFRNMISAFARLRVVSISRSFASRTLSIASASASCASFNCCNAVL